MRFFLRRYILEIFVALKYREMKTSPCFLADVNEVSTLTGMVLRYPRRTNSFQRLQNPYGSPRKPQYLLAVYTGKVNCIRRQCQAVTLSIRSSQGKQFSSKEKAESEHFLLITFARIEIYSASFRFMVFATVEVNETRLNSIVACILYVVTLLAIAYILDS